MKIFLNGFPLASQYFYFCRIKIDMKMLQMYQTQKSQDYCQNTSP